MVGFHRYPLVLAGWLENPEKTSGWWLTYPSEKYESVGMMTFPTEWKNHPVIFQSTNQKWMTEGYSMVFPFYKLQAICHPLPLNSGRGRCGSGNSNKAMARLWKSKKRPQYIQKRNTRLPLNITLLIILLAYQREKTDQKLSGLAIQMGIQGCTNDIKMFGGTSFHPLGFPDHRAFFGPITGLFACKTIQLDWAVRLTAG